MDGEPSLMDRLIFMNDRDRFTDAEFEAALEAVLNEYAHKLAEKIRAAHEEDWDTGQQDFDAHDAADLIDSKEKK